MKIELSLASLGDSPENFLRRAGYALLPEREDGEISFARRFSRDFYPRFHIYFKVFKRETGDLVVFNLHLDQKKPGYVGFSRHNAEYDGELVEREADRIKSLALPAFFL